MRRLFIALFVFALFSCKKETIDPSVPEGALYKIITVNGKVHTSFDYADGLLVKKSDFSNCDTPYWITSFAYRSGKLYAVKSAVRGIYSSFSGALCDPKGTYDESISTREYDGQGRLAKLNTQNSFVEYQYNGQEVIQKFFDSSGNNVRTHYLKYDDRGNVLEEKTPDPVNGGATSYTYDTKRNPLGGKGATSAFNGPNNAVKAFDAAGKQLWERKFTYNNDGLPSECLESNGAVYVYHYK